MSSDDIRNHVGDRKKKKSLILKYWYLWIVVLIIIGGCFIPFEKESKSPVTKSFNIVEMAKGPASYVVTKCKNELECEESLHSFLIDELIFSNNGCLESECDSDDEPMTFYLSSTNKIYSSASAAEKNETDSIDEVSYELKSGVEKPYSTLKHTRDCYAYGLICPEGFDYEHQYQSITMDVDLKVKRYESDCTIYNDTKQMEDYYSVCYRHDPNLVGITSILKEVKSYSYE